MYGLNWLKNIRLKNIYVIIYISVMSSITFNMNTFSDVNINTFLYESTSGSAAVDYVLDVKITQADLFSSATYKQNENDTELFDINIQLNSAGISSAVLAATGSTMTKGPSVPGTLNPAYSNIDNAACQQILEIMSMKIFGHPKAAAAISNDTTFTTDSATHLNQTISSALSGTFTSAWTGLGTSGDSDAALDVATLFKYYTELGRISSSDDITSAQPLVFEVDDQIAMPIVLAGQLYGEEVQGGVTAPNSAVYRDSGAIGKDNGVGFISNGSNNAFDGQALAADHYRVPVMVRFNIVAP